MLRLFIFKTSWEMDRVVAECQSSGKRPWVEIERRLSDQVAMCNFWANRLCCQAARPGHSGFVAFSDMHG